MSAKKTAASAAGQAWNPSAGRESDGPGVLPVDGGPARLRTCDSILAGLEVRRVEAHSGAEALNRPPERDLAAVLLDVSKPAMDGLGVVGAVRQHARCEQMLRSSAAGFGAHRGKPVQVRGLVTVPGTGH